MNTLWGRGALICGPSGEETRLGKKVSGVGCGRQEICSTEVQLVGRVTDCSKEQRAASPQGTAETSQGQEGTKQRLLPQNVFTHSLGRQGLTSQDTEISKGAGAETHTFFFFFYSLNLRFIHFKRNKNEA